jgi:uroporphyrinogen decarboxylase
MTSRERVLAALNHIQPDRVPIDLSGHRSSGISAIAYRRLREYLGLEPRPLRVYDPIQQLAIVDEDILQRFRVDTIELGRAFALQDKDWADWVLPDDTPCQMPVWTKPDKENGEWVLRSRTGRPIGRMPAGVLYFEQCHYPLAESDSDEKLAEAFDQSMWTAMASPPGPLVSGPDGPAILAEGARKLRQQTDRAIIGLFGGNLLEMGQFFYRNDNFFLLLAGEPERAHRFLDRIMQIHLANLERFLGAVGPYIDVVLFGDDLGMQTGPQISVPMYREFFKPREKILWQRAKQLTKAKIMLHCCGGVRELLPDLIEVGLDTMNPVQITCRGMDPKTLKAEFGKRFTFWGGGCDTRYMLSKGTPKEIREHVRDLIQIWKPGGGFIFQQVHNIMADVPPANIVAMYEAALEFGR